MPKTDAALSLKDKFPKLNLSPAPATGPQKAPSDLDSSTEMIILPDPVGYNMLIALPTMAEQTRGGIILLTATNERERAAAVIGTVLALGPLCYKDLKRFPDGKPWCQVGTTVMFSRYSGMRFKSKDTETGEMVEYRMLSDDQIVGTVPEGAEVGGL
jgi:co-chaperonin GroES (HSP10)